jgi:hypothetical protein
MCASGHAILARVLPTLSCFVSRPVKPLIHQLLLLLLLLVMCAVVYMPGLQGPMLHDDFPQLSGLLSAQSADWRQLSDAYLMSDSGYLGRPVSMASFIANAILHGGELRDWKATNLLIHALTAIVVFFLARVLLRASPSSIRPEQAGWLALLVAGLWLLHALHVSTVLYTVQRMAQLSTLFVLAGLLLYSSGRLRQMTARGKGGWQISLAFLLCLPLAVFSKENGILLLLLVPLVEVLVFRGAGLPVMRSGSWRIWPALMLLPLLAGVLYLLLHADHFLVNGYASKDFTPLERLLTQPRVLVRYLHQLLVPLPGLMGFYHDDMLVSKGLMTPVTTSGSILLLAALVGLALLIRRRQPVIALGILFFLVAHLMESTILPLDLMFEHRNYLASFGVLLALVALLARFIRHPRVLAAAGIVLLLSWSSLTVVRAGIWGSPSLLAAHTAAVHPDSKHRTARR